MSLKLENPCSIVISGASGTGKTNLVLRLIDHVQEMFNNSIKRIVFFYEVWQTSYEAYLQKVEFLQGLPTEEFLKQAKDSLIILDDQMHSKNTALISKIFTVYSHHYGFSVIETLQNIFHKSHREITLNAKIIILFKNCRDVTQIACFLRQAFPERHRDVLNAYKDATSSPHGYFVLDFRTTTPDSERLRTGIFPNELNYVYQ